MNLTIKEFCFVWFGICEGIAYLLSCLFVPVSGIPVSLLGLYWLISGFLKD